MYFLTILLTTTKTNGQGFDRILTWKATHARFSVCPLPETGVSWARSGDQTVSHTKSLQTLFVNRQNMGLRRGIQGHRCPGRSMRVWRWQTVNTGNWKWKNDLQHFAPHASQHKRVVRTMSNLKGQNFESVTGTRLSHFSKIFEIVTGLPIRHEFY